MSQRLLQIDVLPEKCRRIQCDEFDLIVEQIVEISGVQNNFAGEEVLLEPGFKGSVSLRFQIGVGNLKRADTEGFFKPWFFDSGSVRKLEARSGKYLASTQNL